MKGLDSFTDSLPAADIIMTMLWIMLTGAALWVIDNLMKNLENPMEDGFKHQARALNRSLRVNFAVILLCLSAYGYIKFYLKTEISTLPGLVGNVLWVLASVGKFLLHLLSYLVYWGQNAFYPERGFIKPEADQDVFVGFIVLVGYILVRKVIAQKMSPAVWALIVMLVIILGTYLTNKNPDLIKRFKKNDRDTTVQVTPNPQIPVIKEEDDSPSTADEHNLPQKEKSKERLLKELDGDIEEFIRDYADNVPKQENYADNDDFIDAFNSYDDDIKTHNSYKAIINVCKELEKRGAEFYKKEVIQKRLRPQLCAKYSDPFIGTGLCEIYAN